MSLIFMFLEKLFNNLKNENVIFVAKQGICLLNVLWKLKKNKANLMKRLKKN